MDKIVAAHPAKLGAAMDVPFISPFLLSVAFGTVVIATPGAQMSTPRAPSNVGPREDHVCIISDNSKGKEYKDLCELGDAYALTVKQC